VHVKLGLFVYATELGCQITEVGQLAEQYHLESLFVCEHSHVPAPPTPYVDPNGNVLPVYYSHIFDPLITLAALAGTTSTLILGTATCIVAQRDPITTAKEVATLDQLSLGRIEFGAGTGWSHDESRGHGVDPNALFTTLRQKLLLMRQLWTSDNVDLPDVPGLGPIAQWPRPYRQPHPPVLVAGNGPRILARVEEFGDGWLLTYRHPDMASGCAELRALRQRTGRPYPATIVAGDPDAKVLTRYSALGIDRALLAVTPGTREETEERIAAIAERRTELDVG
jgi:probable F420-dependent oxidoreductase